MRLLLLSLLLAQDRPAFRSDVALVHVDAEVREDGKPVADLEKESFRVTDQGRPQEIVYFGHDEEGLDLVLVFDCRRQVRPDLKRIREAAQTALSELREGDRVAVMAFGMSAGDCRNELISDFTADFGAVERSVGGTLLQGEPGPRNSGFCSIQRGLSGAAQRLLSLPGGNRRRAIVIVTDDKGVPVRSEMVRDTVRDLWEADAVVLGVIVHSGEVVITIGPPYRGARYAAEKTGGDILKTEDAAEGLREMLHRLRTRCSLYYALPTQGTPGEERKIRVQLSPAAAKLHPRAVVRARTGYVVPPLIR